MSDSSSTSSNSGTPGSLGKVAAAVLVLLVGVAGVRLLVDAAFGDDPETAVAESTEASGETEGPVEPTEPAASSEPTESAEPTASPAGRTLLTVTAVPNSSGEVDVVEQIRWADPTYGFVLLPPPTRAEGGPAAEIVSLSVEADGRPVGDLPSPTLTGTWQVDLPEQSRDVVLRYRLRGATKQSRRAPSDQRALVALRPLAAPGKGESSALVRVDGVVVHNLVCTDRPLAEQLCGRKDEASGLWTTPEVPGTEATVLALVDLPRT